MGVALAVAIVTWQLLCFRCQQSPTLPMKTGPIYHQRQTGMERSDVAAWIIYRHRTNTALSLQHYTTHPNAHNRLMALFQDYLGKPVPERQKQSGFYWSKRQWVAVASAGHSREITTPAPHHSVFYRPDALPAAQPTAPKHHPVS